MRVGVALSGGAFRGVAHIGVLKAFEEAEVPIAFLSGCSAGALVGGAYACGLRADDLLTEAYRMNDRLLDFNSSGAAKAVVSRIAGRKVAFSGVMRGEEVWRFADRLTGGRSIDNAPGKLAVGAVDITSGNTVYYTNEPKLLQSPDFVSCTGVPMADAIAASCAIPGIFVPRRINGRLLVDGGVSEYLPARVLKAMGADYIIAVDLGRKQYDGIASEDITHLVARSYEIMSRSLVDCTVRDSDLIISPYVADIGLFDFSRVDECVNRGYLAAKKLLPTIKAALFHRERQRAST